MVRFRTDSVKSENKHAKEIRFGFELESASALSYMDRVAQTLDMV